MRRIFWIAFAVLVVLLVSIKVYVPERRDVPHWFASQRAEAGDVLDFSAAADFPWTRLCVVGPYAVADLDSLAGFHWTGPGAGVNDDETLLMFLDDEAGVLRRKAAGAVVLHSALGFAAPVACYDRPDARFEVVADDDRRALVPLR